MQYPKYQRWRPLTLSQNSIDYHLYMSTNIKILTIVFCCILSKVILSRIIFILKGSYDAIKFSFLFGVLQAVHAEIRCDW